MHGRYAPCSYLWSMEQPIDLSVHRTTRTREAVTLRMNEVLGMVSELLEELSLVREQLALLERTDAIGHAPKRARRPRRPG